MPTPAKQELLLELRRRNRERIEAGKISAQWPDTYRNKETGRHYQPHHEAERRFVFEDGPWRYGLAKGGEGGGKSVAGIVKVLNRLKRGMNGIMVSPDLPHFKRSLWPEFKRWCPWDQVIDSQQYRGGFSWEPNQPFSLGFKSGAMLYCGGIENPESWEGPNVSFAHIDEGRRHKKPNALKVLDGRVRIPGSNGEQPQLWITTTPRKHWLYDYFGPVEAQCLDCLNETAVEIDDWFDNPTCPSCGSGSLETEDIRLDFKEKALVISLLTKDNIANLEPDFVENRGRSLTEAEKRVLLEAAWEDIDEGERFLPSMTIWDALQEELPPLQSHEPMIIALDAGVSNDYFAMVGVTPHPSDQTRLAVRWVMKWEPPAGGTIDFQGTPENPGPERVVRWLSGEPDQTNWPAVNYNVLQVCYDPYQLHDMATRLKKGGVVWMEPFGQSSPRLEADKQLLDLILQKRIAHDGNRDLRRCVDNADRKVDAEDRRLRIVKRESALKIDLLVALSMASDRLLEVIGLEFSIGFA